MKRLFPLAGLLLLGSCSLAGPVIKATIIKEEVVFEAFGAPNWPWQSAPKIALRVDRFSVFSREGATWVIERSRDPKCDAGPDQSNFPLTYGHVPACFFERLKASPLKTGVDYRIEIGVDNGNSGSFRMALTIDETGRDADGSDSWPMETHPNSAYPMEMVGPADPANSLDSAEVDSNFGATVPPE